MGTRDAGGAFAPLADSAEARRVAFRSRSECAQSEIIHADALFLSRALVLPLAFSPLSLAAHLFQDPNFLLAAGRTEEARRRLGTLWQVFDLRK